MTFFAARIASFALALTLCANSALAATAPKWLPTWYASPEPAGKADIAITDQTLRQIVRFSAGGTAVRLRLSNAYGTEPLTLDNIHVAHRISGSQIDPASDRPVLFHGQPVATIPPGAYVLSDPIALPVSADSNVAVSFHVPGPVKPLTVHDIQRGVLYTASGDQSAAAELPATKADIGIGNAFPWLAEVEVSGSTAKSTIVAFGDSITDGYGITPDSGHTWPELLSARLHATGAKVSVVNAGLSGNRMLHPGQWARFGDAALARFDRDVLAQPNVSAVIILIGINDLGHAQGPGSPEYVSAADLIGGLSQMAERAHERGLRVYAATLTPFKGTVFKDYYSDEKEDRRQAINAWIRQSTTIDGVIDFDKVLDDPANPGHLLPAYDHGDHLHPSDAGAAAMAAAITLKMLK